MHPLLLLGHPARPPGERLCTPTEVTPASCRSAARLSTACVSARLVALWVTTDRVNCEGGAGWMWAAGSRRELHSRWRGSAAARPSWPFARASVAPACPPAHTPARTHLGAPLAKTEIEDVIAGLPCLPCRLRAHEAQGLLAAQQRAGDVGAHHPHQLRWFNVSQKWPLGSHLTCGSEQEAGGREQQAQGSTGGGGA